MYGKIFIPVIAMVAVSCGIITSETVKAIKAETLQPTFVVKDSTIKNTPLGEHTITFYSHTGNRTATGTEPKAKRTCAVDPKVIPPNSFIFIDGLGYCVAEDTGGLIKGNRVDVFVDTHDEAVNLGVKKREVFILEVF